MPAGTIKPPPEEKNDEKPDSSAQTSPPPSKNEGKKQDSKPKAKRPPGRPPNLESKLTELFTQIGGAVTLVNAADGAAILAGAEPMAAAWNKLAQENAAVKAFLTRLTTGGAIGGVILSTGSVVFAIAANHGAFEHFALPGMGNFNEPEQPMGSPPPPPPPPPIGTEPHIPSQPHGGGSAPGPAAASVQ